MESNLENSLQSAFFEWLTSPAEISSFAGNVNCAGDPIYSEFWTVNGIDRDIGRYFTSTDLQVFQLEQPIFAPAKSWEHDPWHPNPAIRFLNCNSDLL